MAKQTLFILLIGIAFSYIIYSAGHQYQESAHHERFAHEVKRSQSTLKSHLLMNNHLLEGIGAFFNSSQSVERHEFNTYVEGLLKKNNFIRALEWIPRVPFSQRSIIEKQAQQDGFPNFQIRERSDSGVMIPAKKRDEYYPVLYIQPYAGNENALGFDKASSPTRRRSIQQAIDSGKPVATDKVTLVQEKQNQTGFLIFYPIYKSIRVPSTQEERRQNIRGFILGVYQIEDMIEKILTAGILEKMNLVIFEGNTPQPEHLLHGQLLENPALQMQNSVLVGGREWTLIWQIDQRFKEFNPDVPMIAGSVSFLIFVLLAIIFQLNHSKRIRVENEVQIRTRELGVKNSELEEFSYRTSHDLKAPLMNIRGLSHIMKEDLEDGDYQEVTANVDKVLKLVLKLEHLIDDMLQLTRVDYENEPIEEVNVERMVTSIRESLSSLIEGKQIEISVDHSGSALVMTQKKLLQSVLENLISNGIKYSDPDKPHRYVKVHVDQAESGTRIQVSDNGLGIPEKHIAEVFGMFKRFHKESSFGSGLGLYLVKKNMNKIHGTISVQSNTEGTVFTLLLPAPKLSPTY